MLFALNCTDKPDHLSVRMDTRPAHVDFLNGLDARGALKFAGPFVDGDGKPNGTLAVIEVKLMLAAIRKGPDVADVIERFGPSQRPIAPYPAE